MRSALRFAPALLLALAACGGSSSSSAPPAITTQPAAAAVLPDLTATFTVVASGASGYQWRRNGTAISGATAASYTTPPAVEADDHAVFTVVVSDTGGSVTSAGAELRVVATPTITADAQSTAATQGGSASFSVAATGNGTLSYQWFKDGTAIPGATLPSLEISGVTVDAGGGYTCTVTNAVGAVKATRDSSAWLTVLDVPVITQQPAGATVVPGDAWTFWASATTSNFSHTYQWRKDGVDLDGATGSTYGLASVTTADAGTYTCVVSNAAYGVAVTATTAAAVLEVVTVPLITAQPGPRSVVVGQPATFRVSAKGEAPLTFQWQKGGVDVAGATSASYTTPPAAAGDGGAVFRVVVTNGAGSVTSASAPLTVQPAVAGLTASATTITAGEGVRLSYVVPPGSTATLARGAAAPAPVVTGSEVAFPADPSTTYDLAVTRAGATTHHTATVALKTYLPRFIHVVNTGSDDVTSYAVTDGPAIGAPGPATPAGHQPIHAVASPAEDRLYVSNAGDGTVSGFAVDAASGALSPLPGSPYALSSAAAAPWAAAMAPSGAWLYVACAEGVEVFGVDLASGALSAAPAKAVAIAGRVRGDVVIHPSGKALYVADAGHAVVKGYAVAADGSLAFTGEAPVGLDVHGLALDRAGTVLFARGMSPVPGWNGQLDAIAVAADGTLGAASTWAGFGTNAFLGADLPFVRAMPTPHGVATSRRPGLDMVFDGYDGENFFNTSFSTYLFDRASAAITAEWQDPTGAGFSSPTWIASGWDIVPNGGSMTVDRSGGLIVTALPGNWNRLYAWTQAVDATILFIGDPMLGQTWKPTGTDPAHACFTGVLQ